MAVGSFIAGRYSSTLGASSLGITEQGYEVTFTAKAEMIDESDLAGLSLIEIIYRGVDAEISLNALEYSAAGMQSAFWPWNATIGNPGVIARLGSAIAASMVLTSTASTPAASSPASLTAARAILAPGFNVSLLFNSKLRRVPLRMKCLPNDGFTALITTT